MNLHQTRRDWLKTASLLLMSTEMPSRPFTAPYSYLPANPPAVINPPLPTGKTVPFDWPYAEVPVAGGDLHLTWPATTAPATGSALLRLTSATDVREPCLLDLRLARTGTLLGTLDVRYAHYQQPFECNVPAGHLGEVIQEGLLIRMRTGTKPFWFFCATPSASPVPRAFQPNLLVGNAGKNAWQERLLSPDSLQTFGWMEGCVLDGLQALVPHEARAQATLQHHLDLFFGQNRFQYEGLNNEQIAGRVNTVESLLPFALLARQQPTHPALDIAVAFVRQHADGNGVVADGTGDARMIKTEECYTVSYPLAILAGVLKQPDLVDIAIQTALARVRVLRREASIFQRGIAGQEPFFENWARGVAWYMLGLAKTVVHLPASAAVDALTDEFRSASELAMQYQQPTGLWSCFMHQPETGIDTSGSAGIAAALAYGQQHALLPVQAKKQAKQAQKALATYLTPDGYLRGTAQVNKGGEALQRNGFRVISPYTLGFLGQLDAALR